jgi:hypothetical protein
MDGNRTRSVELPYGVSFNMQAEYVMKVQVIRSKKQPPRFYVNIPLPLAAALDLEAGESVQWQLLERTDLRLRRLEAKKAPRRLKR